LFLRGKLRIQAQMNLLIAPKHQAFLLSCLASSYFGSEDSFLFLHHIVTVIVWVFGAAGVVVAILLFRHREEEIFKLLVAELICTVVVEICLLIFPFLDDRLNRLRDQRMANSETNFVILSNKWQQTKTQLTNLTNAEARIDESVANLREENSPMDIGEEFSFVNALRPLAGIRVELRYVADGKAEKTAESLRSCFVWAGWPVINTN
jgi:hypothetical protein